MDLIFICITIKKGFNCVKKAKQYVKRMLEVSQWPRNLLFCVFHGLKFDGTWRFYGLPYIRKGGRGSEIRIGHHFTAVSVNSHNSFGIIQKVVIRTVGHGARIYIGNNVGVSGCTISAGRLIKIGDNVLIGSGVIITDGDAHPIDPEERKAGVSCIRKSVLIEDDVFIGARAVILKGVTVGRGAVIGACAVVTKDVPPYSIVVGNPARIIGDSREANR